MRGPHSCCKCEKIFAGCVQCKRNVADELGLLKQISLTSRDAMQRSRTKPKWNEGVRMRRLPPLTAVEAFIHVARLGSMKAAAEELSLSAPALSRRVHAPE